SYKLEDVWVGTYRIKVNLSRYCRKGSKPLGAQDKSHGVGSSSGVQDKRHGVGSSGGNHALVDKFFRSALVEDVIVPTLIGSCVGRMREGVEIKKLQMKLGLAGLQAVKVLDMEGNVVLFSRGPEAEVGSPVNNIKWWEGMPEELKPWSPNQMWRVCLLRY
ncbi:hypothetical protein A2U01_0037896, partial [Trifolium medium]|nr:hypothetical protein [Trifolium medium]